MSRQAHLDEIGDDFTIIVAIIHLFGFHLDLQPQRRNYLGCSLIALYTLNITYRIGESLLSLFTAAKQYLKLKCRRERKLPKVSEASLEEQAPPQAEAAQKSLYGKVKSSVLLKAKIKQRKTRSLRKSD
jgi:hypothetical protein